MKRIGSRLISVAIAVVCILAIATDADAFGHHRRRGGCGGYGSYGGYGGGYGGYGYAPMGYGGYTYGSYGYGVPYAGYSFVPAYGNYGAYVPVIGGYSAPVYSEPIPATTTLSTPNTVPPTGFAPSGTANAESSPSDRSARAETRTPREANLVPLQSGPAIAHPPAGNLAPGTPSAGNETRTGTEGDSETSAPRSIENRGGEQAAPPAPTEI